MYHLRIVERTVTVNADTV